MSDNHNDMFRRLLADAGVRPGQRVLDVGCGPGETTGVLREVVGPDGAVVGLDRSDDMLEKARARVHQRGWSNVRFCTQDLGAESILAGEANFDAIVGRRVLMYLPDPEIALRGLMRHLAPDGVVAFQEHAAWLAGDAALAYPLHAKTFAMVWETVRREGGNTQIGVDLPSMMQAAGLQVEEARGEALIEGYGRPRGLGWVVTMIAPRIIEHGVATATELDLPTLAGRLAAERDESGSLIVGGVAFAVWARRKEPSN